jgi:HD-GYP domain-containing protein (c-di-GMP phosphodiesterase class II)
VLTEQNVRELIARRTETKNLDYKESLDWNAATPEQKGEVVKDVLAMSNSHDGGCIVFGVRDGDFEAVGLNENDFMSFDITRFSDFLNRYADPPLECAIQKFVFDSKRLVTIEVPEFRDVPTICKADLNGMSHRQVLKKGATYVRTERAASEIVPSADIMRELLDRAVVKRGDQFFKMVDRVIAGQTTLSKPRVTQAEHEEALSALRRSYDITLEILADVLDLSEASIAGHSKRVTAFSIAIAYANGIPRNEINEIARGAFLHEFGKIWIPKNILLKPGALTHDELATVREYCLKGYQLVRRIPFLDGAAEIVYAQNEHYNGKGYPRGLKESEIPLGARILAVANAVDSITSDLPYRKGRSFEDARAEIQRLSFSQFDPKIVDAFQGVSDNVFRDLRREIGDKPKLFK